MQTLARHERLHAAAEAGGGTIRQRRIGAALSVLAVLFLVVDSSGKLLEVQPAVQGTIDLGYPRHTVFGLGAILLSSVVTYAIPRTSVLGALLLTGYLGGAVAAHVRVDSPVLTHTLFPIYVAAVAWGGLVLRDPRLSGFLPVWRRW